MSAELVAFLRARLNEKEWSARVVKDVAAKRTHYRRDMIAQADRDLRAVASTRRLIAEYERAEALAEYPDRDGGYADGLEYAVQCAAAERCTPDQLDVGVIGLTSARRNTSA